MKGPITREELFDYRMGRLVKKFVEDNEIGASGEEIADAIWKCFLADFGRAVVDEISEFNGFEFEEYH